MQPCLEFGFVSHDAITQAKGLYSIGVRRCLNCPDIIAKRAGASEKNMEDLYIFYLVEESRIYGRIADRNEIY